MNKIPAQSITVKHATGKISDLGEQTFQASEHKEKLFEVVNTRISRWAINIDGGYDDIDFEIVFEDGYVYRGRLEITNPLKNRNETLEKHIEKHCLYYSGRKLLENQTQAENDKFLETFSPEPHRSELARVLDTYQLGDD